MKFGLARPAGALAGTRTPTVQNGATSGEHQQRPANANTMTRFNFVLKYKLFARCQDQIDRKEGNEISRAFASTLPRAASQRPEPRGVLWLAGLVVSAGVMAVGRPGAGWLVFELCK